MAAAGGTYSPFSNNNITPGGKDDLASLYEMKLKKAMSDMGIATLNQAQSRVTEEFFTKDGKSAFVMMGAGGG